MFSLTTGILLHLNENVPSPSLCPNLDFSAPVLHFKTEFLLTGILTEGFGLISDFLYFVYG